MKYPNVHRAVKANLNSQTIMEAEQAPLVEENGLPGAYDCVPSVIVSGSLETKAPVLNHCRVIVMTVFQVLRLIALQTSVM